MNILRFLTCVAAFLSIGSVWSVELEPDVDYSEKIVFTIKPKGKSYKLTSNTLRTKKYLSARSVSSTQFYIHDNALSRVKDVKAWVGDKVIDKNEFVISQASGYSTFNSFSRIIEIDFDRYIEQGAEAKIEYKTEYADIADFPEISISNINRLKELELVFQHPRDVAIGFDFYFTHDSIPVIISHDSEKETRLILRDVDYHKPEPYLCIDDSHGSIKVNITRGEEHVTPASVAEFVKWYGELTPLQPVFPDSYKDLPVDELAGLTDPVPKLAAINRWIADNIRYIYEVDDPKGGIVPHKPEVVYERRYGDCKDRAFLMSAFARRQGIDLYAAVVTAEPYQLFDVPTGNDFNHVICAYRQGEHWLFCDPTAEHVTFGFIPEEIIDHYALIFDPFEPELVRLEQPEALPGIVVTTEVNIDSLDNAGAQVRLNNAVANEMQYERGHLNATDMEQLLSSSVSGYFQQMIFSDFQPVGEDSCSLDYTAHLDMSRFIVNGMRYSYLPKSVMNWNTSEMSERENDSWPICLAERLSLDFELTLHGDSLITDSLFEETGNPKSAYSSLRVFSPEKGVVKCSYSVIVARKVLEGDDRRMVLEVNARQATSRSDMITLKREGLQE
ncbi:MAG TPA: transglutaminase-like domain-containing protein [candidate division Zixibacteria bacterium]|nr:transglutaminase-like domain-containing protein [candidate division Zixibacteria bacterium]